MYSVSNNRMAVSSVSLSGLMVSSNSPELSMSHDSTKQRDV
jgi:hypothetical protein